MKTENKNVMTLIFGAIFMLAPFAIDMYLPALPIIANDLKTGIDEMEATVAILLFGFAIGQLIFGPLSDRVGRVVIMRLGLITFTIASLVAGLVANIEQLYVIRLIQALGGAAASVVVLPLIRDRNTATEAAKIISYVMALTVIAPLIAPIIGSQILKFASWSWIFYAIAAFAAITMLASFNWIKSDQGKSETKTQLNISEVLKSFIEILTHKQIMMNILAGAFAFAGLFAFVAGSPFVYITYYGVSAENYGYLVGLNAISMIGVNLVNAKLLSHISSAQKVKIGTYLLAFIGFLMLISNNFEMSLSWLVTLVVAYVGALGLVSTNAIVGALSFLQEKNGTVSALNGAMQFGLGAISSAVISVLSSVDASELIYTMFATAILALLAGYHLNKKEMGVQHA